MDKTQVLIGFAFCVPLICCFSTTRPGVKTPDSPVIWNQPETQTQTEQLNSYEQSQMKEEEAKLALKNANRQCPNVCEDQRENADQDIPRRSDEVTLSTERGNSENVQTILHDDTLEVSSANQTWAPPTMAPTTIAPPPVQILTSPTPPQQTPKSESLEQLSVTNVTVNETRGQSSEQISNQVLTLPEGRAMNVNEPEATNHNGSILSTTTPTVPTTTEPLRPFEKRKYSVTVMMIGRSGSGVSSTIRTLIGPYTKCKMPTEEDSFTEIFEYTISDIPHLTRDYKIKLLDMPGLVDGRTVGEDSQILATLKSYFQQHEIPDLFLVLTKFDDNRIDGAHSLLVQFLKKMELLESLVGTPLPAFSFKKSLFLLTHFMSSAKQMQRRPAAKISQFKKVIDEYTNFPSSHITVGENKAEVDYGTRIEGGYYVLPNREHYPKTLWQSLANASSYSIHSDIFTTMMNNREVNMTCVAELVPLDWEYYEQDVQAFQTILQKGTINITDTLVNTRIQEHFEEADEHTQLEGIVQKTALQLYLQDANYTSPTDFPVLEKDIAKFFQESKLSGLGAYFLSELFRVTMPVYSKPVVVGQSYDLLKGKVLEKSPFKTTANDPTPLGYQLPRFLNCKKNIIQDKQTMRSYSETQREYNKQRLKHLEFEGKENITAEGSWWRWGARDGFNLQPDVSSTNSLLLSMIKEARTCKCVLKQDDADLVSSLSPDFSSAIFRLPKTFDPRNEGQVKKWLKFFETYGTHIVSKAFGGGYLRGQLQINNLDKVWPNLENQVEKVLINLVRFNGTYSVGNLGSPEYRFFGGNKDTRTMRLHYLPKGSRDDTLDAWYNSLESDFIMMDNTLGLTPISSIAKIINKDIGNEVHVALGKLLKGELGRNVTETNLTPVSSSAALSGHQEMVTTERTTTPPPTGGSGVSSGPTPVDAFESFFGSGFESGNFYGSLGKPKPKKPAASSPEAAQAASMKNLKAQFDSTQQALDLAYKRIADMEEEDKAHQQSIMAQRAAEDGSSHQNQLDIMAQVEKEAAERFSKLRENLLIMYTNEIELQKCTGLREFFNWCTFTYLGKDKKPKGKSKPSPRDLKSTKQGYGHYNRRLDDY